MTNCLPSGVIHVNDLRLWAHVGVLDYERQVGQWFTVDFSLWINMERSALEDDLSATADYSLGIKKIQELVLELHCLTIEHFSERILDLLEDIYGSVRMRVVLKKVDAPVSGFTGTVSVERYRNWAAPFKYAD